MKLYINDKKKTIEYFLDNIFVEIISLEKNLTLLLQN